MGVGTERMAKDFSRAFYDSPAWRSCRKGYLNSVNHLCERCLDKGLIVPAEMVHHKTELTPENINNPDITLSFENLQAVCRDCHASIHQGIEKRYKILSDGSVIGVDLGEK